MNKELPKITCSFLDITALHRAYMPFIQGGGLFIRTDENYLLGERVNLSVQLMDEPVPHVIETQVVWITPKGAQGDKPAGIGVQFMGEQARSLSRKIETYLAYLLNSALTTDTL